LVLTPRWRTRGRRAAAAAVVAAATFGGVATAGAQTGAPSGATNPAIQSLREQADVASGAYFSALGHYKELTAQIATIESQLPGLRAQQAAHLKVTVQRAVAAYEQGGSGQLSAIMNSGNILDAARRTQWLQVLNAADDHSLAGLKATSSRLHLEEQTLQTDQASSAAALKVLDAQGQSIDVELTSAVTQQEQVNAAAAAAAGPPLDPGGGGGGSGNGSGAGPSANPPVGEAAFLACVKQHESGGNYQAVNTSNNSYFGAYQFGQPTWNATANHAGRLDLVNVRPDHAAPADQDAMARVLYEWQGETPWNGDGCE
jgi:hypothetical protein